MKPTTLELIKNVLSTDETVQPDDAQAFLKQLQTTNAGRKPRPGTIKQAAEVFHSAKVRQGRATHTH